jgi:hypothetical protein
VPRLSPKTKTKTKAARLVTSTPTPSIPRVTYRRHEAAQALGVNVQTIDSWIAAGTLRASKPRGVSGEPGRYLLVWAADIEAMLVASLVAAA